MNTYPAHFQIAEPRAGERIPVATLSYFRARLRNKLHSLLLRAVKDSGIAPSEIAIRTGKDRAQISRLLGAPGNMTLDTLSDLLFAVDGLELEAVTRRPLQEAARNFSGPEWLPSTPTRAGIIDFMRPATISAIGAKMHAQSRS